MNDIEYDFCGGPRDGEVHGVHPKANAVSLLLADDRTYTYALKDGKFHLEQTSEPNPGAFRRFQLRSLLFRAQHAYYVRDEPFMADSEYDALSKEYEALGGEMPVGSDRDEDYPEFART